MTEREIQHEILTFLSNHPKVGFATKYNAVQASKSARRSKFQPPGISDIIGNMKNGIALYIEVKTPKGRHTEKQKQFLEKRLKNQCVAFTATSIEDCIDAFRSFGY